MRAECPQMSLLYHRNHINYFIRVATRSSQITPVPLFDKEGAILHLCGYYSECKVKSFMPSPVRHDVAASHRQRMADDERSTRRTGKTRGKALPTKQTAGAATVLPLLPREEALLQRGTSQRPSHPINGDKVTADPECTRKSINGVLHTDSFQGQGS